MFRNIQTIGIQNLKRFNYRTSFNQGSFRFQSSTSSQFSWVEYFKLKKQQNIVNIVASTFTSVGGGLLTLAYLGNVELDPEQPIMGFDPIMIMGGVVLLGGGAGWLVGPFLGTSVFNLFNRSITAQFRTKHEIFLNKIKTNRVDPSSQSFSNPVPDYYGERIYSLNGYKQWLRDCNTFRRKSKEFI
ncbi:presequence translocated-associated motor subunit Pam17p, mitochondrial [[Candida] jaroonii]|uniref:Presequence translocated-associated motor subunit Pam17p, mitochondrial n=1 Tax=[Candida] jaroonii TaxID=467808 RepID=A0ACA9YD56_9ASCO|nr:presequence translocated-associated motor subunit Pam17p, mitochondrial [[Candida] jaroonii]